MLEVVGAHRVRIQVDATEVHGPQQLRRVAHDDLSRGPARGKAQLHRLDPLGMPLGSPLLEERLAPRAPSLTLGDEEPRRAPPEAAPAGRGTKSLPVAPSVAW